MIDFDLLMQQGMAQQREENLRTLIFKAGLIAGLGIEKASQISVDTLISPSDDHAVLTCDTLEDAKAVAIGHGLTIGEPHYQMLGCDGGVAQYNTAVISGYNLSPRGLIQRWLTGKWCVLLYKGE